MFVAAACVQRKRSQCQNIVGKPRLDKYTIGNLDNYIWQFGQIRLAILTNTFGNLGKYFGKVRLWQQLACSVRGQNVRMLLATLDFADALYRMVWQIRFAKILIQYLCEIHTILTEFFVGKK